MWHFFNGMKEIIFTAWKPGFNKVGLSKLLRDEAGLPLTEAKSVVASILANRSATVRVASEELAERILGKALALGAIGELKS